MNNKKMKTRTKFVILAASMVIVYAVIYFVFSWNEKELSDTFTTSWFAFWGAELALLAGIKIKSKE